MRVPGSPAGRMPAMALVLMLAPLAAVAAAREERVVDLANLPPGQGFVFGSIDVQWPDQPALAKMGNAAEKTVEVYRIDDPKAGPGGKAALVVRPRVGEDKAFAQALTAGHYLVTCLYYKDVMFGGPTGSCYPVQADFIVTPGKATYVGRIVLRMPSGVMSLHVDVSVLDDRAAAEARLTPKYGNALAAADTRLAAWAGADEALRLSYEAFPRLGAAFGKPEWTREEEDRKVGLHVVRTVVAGRTVDDWDIAFEILTMPRLGQPATPQEWLRTYREFRDPKCPSAWDVLAESQDSALFQRRSPECPPHRAQEALYRMLYGQSGAWLMICTEMGAFDDQTRAECRALLESARIVAR